ncbi:MAG TPA: hypothetical protein VNA19_12115 [Pyrinomonadaceae bacterium]|jgi:hypothetical protein|nr:hypothetical protein [Pyrinomonadaceae bacterium]
MSGRRKIFVLLALLSALVHASAQEAGAPRFEDYRVGVWRGRVAPLNLRTHPQARAYRTVIREQLKAEGVNFAGHYTLASAGCGTGCSISAIVDARTGRAYFPGALFGWTSEMGDYDIPDSEEQRSFRADSRLLQVVGRPNIGPVGSERFGPSGIYYYEWTNNRLRLVKFIPAGSYPQSDPPN